MWWLKTPKSPTATGKPKVRYTNHWQEDRAVAAGGRAQARFAGGGKSELRRAVCRITSGTRISKSVDGQCHRKDTASATPSASFETGRASGVTQVRLNGRSRQGKGEMVR
jgi:hypothetical protein